MQTRPLALQTQATRAFPEESAQAHSLLPEGCVSAPALPLPLGCFCTGWSSPSAWGPLLAGAALPPGVLVELTSCLSAKTISHIHPLLFSL